MSNRRYDEAETRAIFARASEVKETEPRALTSEQGWSLAELQAIGREAGLAPEVVAAAARSIDEPAEQSSRQFLGVTVGVGQTVQLDQTLSDLAWERLVVQLRETFDARGTLRADGRLRQWTNGNLQVLVEPTERGDRVRLRTVHANSRSLLFTGLMLLSGAAILATIAVTRGVLGDAVILGPLLPITAAGVGTFAAGMLRLRSWAPTRRAQMQRIADQLLK